MNPDAHSEAGKSCLKWQFPLAADLLFYQSTAQSIGKMRMNKADNRKETKSSKLQVTESKECYSFPGRIAVIDIENNCRWRSPKEGMATHSSVVAWRIPWTEEPEGLATVQGDAKNQTRLNWLSSHLTIESLHLETRSPKDVGQVLWYLMHVVSHVPRGIFMWLCIQVSTQLKKKIIQEVRELTLVIKYCFWQIKIHLACGNPFLLKDGS